MTREQERKVKEMNNLIDGLPKYTAKYNDCELCGSRFGFGWKYKLDDDDYVYLCCSCDKTVHTYGPLPQNKIIYTPMGNKR